MPATGKGGKTHIDMLQQDMFRTVDWVAFLVHLELGHDLNRKFPHTQSVNQSINQSIDRSTNTSKSIKLRENNQNSISHLPPSILVFVSNSRQQCILVPLRCLSGIHFDELACSQVLNLRISITLINEMKILLTNI
jgi:hypothetical protein